jgi:hypothetical protein
MKQVLILAEGQTEETFLKEVLAPELLHHEVALSITLLKTKRLVNSTDFKGGATSYGQIRRDLLLLLQGKKKQQVTTMLDFYGLPQDTPGLADLPNGDCYAKVSHVERLVEADIGNPLLKVFLTLHEFEAFAFVDPMLILQFLPGEDAAIAKLSAIRANHESPEHINQGSTTAPSKRIKAILKKYKKNFHGPLITQELGVARIANECRHFQEWLHWLQRQGEI